MSLHLDAGLKPIAGYTLTRLLGRGGFGEVWEASAPGDFHVALKFIRLDSKEAGVEQRALDVIRNVRHPHLLDVQFAARVEDCLVIAMPLCDESLMDRLRDRPAGLPRNELLGYLVDLARAIDYLNETRHRASDGGLVGVQHRDIKPHNIFLVGGAVRLADFGLAKVLAAGSASHTGSMSPNYVAPEAIEGRVSKQSDQYSLAVTYIQLRTGKLPFVGESVMQIIYAHIHNAPDLSSLPEHERPVVNRALAKRPEDRWPSCQTFVRALVGAARSEGSRVASQSGSKLVPDVRPEPMTRDFTKLPETQRPPPILPTRIDDGSPSRVAALAMSLRDQWLWVFSLAVVLVGLAVILLISQLGPSPEPAPEVAVAPKPPPAVEHEPAPATRPPEPVMPRPMVPDEPANLITSSIGMKLMLIPSGEFLMGSPDTGMDASDDEKPQHTVRISRPFYLGVYEVTQGQYRAVTGKDPSRFQGSDDLPAENVSWNEATAFCNKLSEREGLRPYYQSGAVSEPGGEGYRLPTEAEWEYSCRAGCKFRYSFGDDAARLGEFGWFDGNSDRKTHPVGQKHPNAFGLYDMHGNVWEWCWDGYKADYYKESPDADPVGPSVAADQVIRGGGWNDYPQFWRSAYRFRSAPEVRRSSLGFRVARVQSLPSSRPGKDEAPAPSAELPKAQMTPSPTVASPQPPMPVHGGTVEPKTPSEDLVKLLAEGDRHRLRRSDTSALKAYRRVIAEAAGTPEAAKAAETIRGMLKKKLEAAKGQETPGYRMQSALLWYQEVITMAGTDFASEPEVSAAQEAIKRLEAKATKKK